MLALIQDDQFSQTGIYQTATFGAGDSITPSATEAPSRQGQTTNKIPFAFINSVDIAADPDVPPLEGLANLCLAIYRGEADYRQNLFMQSQDTLVITGMSGDDDAIRTGAGACIKIPNPDGDAKYVGGNFNGFK